MLAFDTNARTKVSIGGKSPATMSKRKVAHIEAKEEQAHVDLDVRSVHVTKLEARTIELQKKLEQSASHVRVAESRYSLLCYVAQTLKQRLATSAFYDGEME